MKAGIFFDRSTPKVFDAEKNGKMCLPGEPPLAGGHLNHPKKVTKNSQVVNVIKAAT